MAGLSGLSTGLERGMRLGMMLDNRKLAQEDRERRQAREDEAYGWLKEDRANQEKIRDAYMTKQYFKLLKNPEGYKAAFADNPGMIQKFETAVKRFGVDLANQRGTEYETTDLSFVPTGDGRVAVNLTIKDGDKIRQAPMTVKGTADPGDTVAVFTPDDFEKIADLELKRLDAELVGLGDMSPIKNQAKQAERAAGLADKKEMIDYEANIKRKYGLSKDTDTALIKNAKFLMRNAGFKNYREAVDYLNTSKFNAQSKIADITGRLIAAQTNAGIIEDDPEYKTPADFKKVAEQIVNGTPPEPKEGKTWTVTTKDGKEVTITMKQIEETAKNRRMTPEEVMNRLGIDPKEAK